LTKTLGNDYTQNEL